MTKGIFMDDLSNKSRMEASLIDDKERIRQRRLLAAEISDKMNAVIRTMPPSEADAANWESSIDVDTNKIHWFPKKLFDEYNRLRFSDEGKP